MTTEDQNFLNAYLVVGSDELKTQAVIKRLWSRLETLGDLDFNSQILDGTKDIDLKLLLDSLNTPPLAAPYRVVVIKGVDKCGKVLMEALVQYLTSPMESTILVLTATKLTQQSRLYKAVHSLNSKAIIDASDRKPGELPATVRQLVQGYQLSISHEAASKVAELAGTSTMNLNNEVKKLASYVMASGRNEVTMEDVSAVVTHTKQPTTWNFVDAFFSRDIVLCLNILNALSRETPVGLLSLCTVRLRELLNCRSLMARGVQDETKLAQALGKQNWQVRKIKGSAAKFEAAELRGLLIKAARADLRMKSGEDPRLVLEEFVLATSQ